MVQFKSFTDPGTRPINEDSFGTACYRDSFCFVVADGLGGHGGGEVASRLAVDAVCDLFLSEGWSDSFFRKALDNAQRDILAEQQRQMAPSRMKTTIVILVIHDGKAYQAHVGDSRIYFFRSGKLKKRTVDHSVPQMLALAGEIKESEIRHHPDRSRLLRVLGISGDVPNMEVEAPIRLHGESAFLLCTDGFWELLEDGDMERLLRTQPTPEAWVDAQTQLIRMNGQGVEMDNFTCIAIKCRHKGILGW